MTILALKGYTERYPDRAVPSATDLAGKGFGSVADQDGRALGPAWIEHAFFIDQLAIP
jgi:hypothetical protein